MWVENMFFGTITQLLGPDTPDAPPFSHLHSRITVPTGGLNFPATIYTISRADFQKVRVEEGGGEELNHRFYLRADEHCCALGLGAIPAIHSG